LGVKTFQRLITFLNEFQTECLKNQSYNPWKDLSNAILIPSIGVDLTSEIVKNVKPNSHYGILVGNFGRELGKPFCYFGRYLL